MNKVKDNRERVSASALVMQMLSFTPALKVEKRKVKWRYCLASSQLAECREHKVH